MKAVRVHSYGDIEALSYENVEKPEPAEGEARIKIEAAGVNFIDIYLRKGQYPAALPSTLGMEGAGIVDAIGENVDEVKVGDRVVYAMQQGSYAEYAIVESWKLVHVPEDLDIKLACAAMLQGLTAHYLSHSTYVLLQGETALIHAAAGGVGQLLVQMAARRGARVIATVSTNEKAELARAAGADEIILYTEQDFAEEAHKLTDGKGVDVVYDSVGESTFWKSLDSLRPRGLLALYGQASGPVPPIDPQILNLKGSLFLTRPTLGHYTATRKELLERADELLGWVQSGELKVVIDATFPLEDAQEAHRYLEARQSKGKVLLVP
jgi:NADPH2:quinone reductase